MSKQLDKLKEVSSAIDELLIKLETHIFVENITMDYGARINEYEAERLVKLK